MFLTVLLACGAGPAPAFVVENRVSAPAPAFVVTNRVPAPAAPAVVPVPDAPRREFWPGFGTVEWRDGSWHKVADPGVSAAPHFRPGDSGPDTGARTVLTSPPGGRVLGSSGGTTGMVPTIILAPGAGPRGLTTNCSPFG